MDIDFGLSSKRLISLSYQICMLSLAFLMAYPILWLISSSFKNESEIFLTAHSLIPKAWTPSNYPNGWRGFGGYSFATYFRNSFIIAILATAGVVMSSAVVAYGFARIRFAGKRIWFICMMLSMMLPFQVIMIPQYVIFHRLKWVNTFNPLIVPSFLGQAFFIFMIMQFIRSIPSELDESAIIDGCTKSGIFIRIIVPLVKPALVTVSIFSFYWRWNDFLGPLLYLHRPKLYPVSIALKLFADPNSLTNWGYMFAMAALSLIPVLLVFFIFQRHISEGISTTGLKG